MDFLMNLNKVLKKNPAEFQKTIHPSIFYLVHTRRLDLSIKNKTMEKLLLAVHKYPN